MTFFLELGYRRHFQEECQFRRVYSKLGMFFSLLKVLPWVKKTSA